MEHNEFEKLPKSVRDYIDLVVKKMRYRKRVRAEANDRDGRGHRYSRLQTTARGAPLSFVR